jgi:RHS repeat-associated protein
MNEIAILDNEGEIKQLRIPGLSIHPDVLRPIAIETQRGIFAPIHDSQGKIIKLINVATKEVTDLSSVDPFGRGIPEDIPTSWTYWGKNYDAEAGLVYFGKRYYSPLLREWLTPDPMKQSEDLYEYCLGNPFLYFDPDGQFSLTFLQIAWGAGVAITTPIWGPYAVATAAGVAAAYGLHKVCEHMEEKRHARWREKNYQPPNNWDCYRNKAGELQRQVEKGQAPDSVDRVDKGTGPHEKEHVHFKDDHALNYDGTWKHGGRRVSNREKAWLEGNGWRAPQ